MKILFVAMADNIHTARWINQLCGSEHELHLFPSIPNRPLHPLLKGKVIYHPFPSFSSNNVLGDYVNRAILHLTPENSHMSGLIRLIGLIRPILIHSLEFQSAGYLTLKAKMLVKNNFPKWLATNWGSDINYFGKLKKHQDIIKQLLNECNYYSCECPRDVELAKQFGFKGKTFLSTTNTGGYDLDWVQNNQVKITNKRKIIMLKGYQGWAGRAITAINALETIGYQLRGYELVIYSVNPPNIELVNRAQKLTEAYGMRLTLVPLNTEHKEIFKLHGQARISIGLSISDALSTSAIEAIIMGSFPIQSNTACVDRYIQDGMNGFLVPPEDTKMVAEKIREALTNDQLVEKAYEYNQLYVAPKFEYEKLKQETLKMYSEIFYD